MTDRVQRLIRIGTVLALMLPYRIEVGRTVRASALLWQLDGDRFTLPWKNEEGQTVGALRGGVELGRLAVRLLPIEGKLHRIRVKQPGRKDDPV